MSLIQVQWQIDKIPQQIQSLRRSMAVLQSQIEIETNRGIDTSSLINAQNALMMAIQSLQTQKDVLCNSREYKAEMMESYGTIPVELEELKNVESMNTEEVLERLSDVTLPAPPGGWSRRL